MSQIGRQCRGILALAFVAFFVPAFDAFSSPAGEGDMVRTIAGPIGRVGSDPASLSGVQSLMLELDEPAAAVRYTQVLSQSAQARTNAEGAARNQKLRNEAAQAVTLRSLSTASPGATVLYRMQSAYNGIAIRADVKDLDKLRRLPNVKAVHAIPRIERENANSVPLINAPQVWKSLGLTGSTIRMGIIDTGIDYIHANFGGSGSAADLTIARDATNNPVTTGAPYAPAFTVSNGVTQLYPSAKVVGGWDFVGDAYAGGSGAIPDPNPCDCPSSLGGGHGSHVAGSAGGFGVKSDGATYTGPWDDTTPFPSLRIGPGVAPEAKLYALRVFGCNGSTDFAAAAIDWAVDPNGDGNPADHLDVINMSLGSSFGAFDDPTSVASTNAVSAGVIVVASAGNSYDVHYITGSPGSTPKVLSVASSVDSADVVDGFSVTVPPGAPTTHPALFSVNYAWSTSPDTTAPLYYPATNQDGCVVGEWSAGDVTKMAGKVVVLDWTLTPAASSRCGSTTRANNVQARGAVGLILVDDVPYFELSISGNFGIPAVNTVSTVGAILKAAAPAGTEPAPAVNATLSNSFSSNSTFSFPASTDTLSPFTSRGPQGGNNLLKPDISAPGQGIFSTDAGTGNLGTSLNGTSMAAPHMAGVMALLKQRNPAWSVEELKALAMNYASHDLYLGQNQTGVKFAPARVGAGRVDAQGSADATVVAYSADDAGAVSVSFGALEIAGNLILSKAITVSNKGASAVTYDLSIDPRTSIDGISFSFPGGNQVTVPANGTVAVVLQLDADAALMKNTRDATVAATQGGFARHYLSEASGLVVLTPSAPIMATPGSEPEDAALVVPVAAQPLRVPYYVAARPASQMSATATTITPTGDNHPAVPVTLTGSGVNTGGGAPVFPSDYLSIVTPMEHAHTDPLETLASGVPERARHADIQHVGVTAVRSSSGNPSRVGNSRIFFGITTHGSWSTPATTNVEFDIHIDTNRDGNADYILYNSRPLTDGDIFLTRLYKVVGGAFTYVDYLNMYGGEFSTAIFNTNAIVLPVEASVLSMGASTRFNYRIYSYSNASPLGDPIDDTPWLTFDYAAPGLDFNAARTYAADYEDLPGATLPVVYNRASFVANASIGALLVHHFNEGATKPELLTVGCPVITVTPPAVATGSLGVPFSQAFTATGWLGALTYATTSTLPTGLTLAADGTLSGTPTQGGSFPITVTATTADGCKSSGVYTLTIALPTISIGDAMVVEGAVGPTTSMLFTVTLSPASGSTVTVNAATAPGSASAADFVSKSETLTFGPGVVSQPFTVAVNDDGELELTESFSVILSGAVNATIAASTGTGTIIDNDEVQEIVDPAIDDTDCDPVVGGPCVLKAISASGQDRSSWNYSWFVGGIRVGSGSTFSPQLLAPGTYVITVEVISNAGTIGSATITLVVEAGCPAGSLCVQGNRFEVRLTATDPRSGRSGNGVPLVENDQFGYFTLPSLTGSTAIPEVFVKILDGRPVNGQFWVFYGGLTDLQYELTVLDKETGVTKTYTKPAGSSAGGFDTGSGVTPEACAGEVDGSAGAQVAPGACTAGSDRLCLLGGRFLVELTARDPRTGNTGKGRSIPENDIFGYFSLPELTGDVTNPEVFVKMIDGNVVNGHYWTFYAGLTDLEYTVKVTDTTTGAVKNYTKAGGSACGGFDTNGH